MPYYVEDWIITILILTWAVIWGVATKTVNQNKGYEGGFWWGFFLSFIGMIVVACKPNQNPMYDNPGNVQVQQDAELANLQKVKMYKELADSGIITQSEFEIKKTELLNLSKKDVHSQGQGKNYKKLAQVSVNSDGAMNIISPMSGKVIQVLAGVGSAVKRDDVIMRIRTMQVEINITAPVDGTVSGVLFGVGNKVEQGDCLVVMH